MVRGALGTGHDAGAEFPARQGQIVQHLIIGLPDLVSGEAADPRKIQSLDVGIVKGSDVNGQADGYREDPTEYRHRQ